RGPHTRVAPGSMDSAPDPGEPRGPPAHALPPPHALRPWAHLQCSLSLAVRTAPGGAPALPVPGDPPARRARRRARDHLPVVRARALAPRSPGRARTAAGGTASRLLRVRPAVGPDVARDRRVAPARR